MIYLYKKRIGSTFLHYERHKKEKAWIDVMFAQKVRNHNNRGGFSLEFRVESLELKEEKSCIVHCQSSTE